MKLAIFHTEFAYAGGAERMLFEQMKYLRKAGWKVVCFSAFVDKKGCYPDEIGKYPIKQVLPGFINKILPHDLIIVLTTLLFPLSLRRYRGFDMFLGENQAGPWWAFMAGWFWHKPYFIYQNYPTTVTRPREIDKGARRNSWLVNLLIGLAKPVMVAVDKRIIRGAKGALADGDYVKEVCEEAYGRKFVNCPGGVKVARFDKKIFEKRYKGKINLGGNEVAKPYILVTNRHFPAKRLDYAVKVAKKIGARLVVSGAWTGETEKLIGLANKLGVEKKVFFSGLMGEKELEQLYKNAAVYLYTAPEEDFGLGILEAMAHGVPVVVWNKAGPGRIVRNGVEGMAAPADDLTKFSAAVKKLLVEREVNWKMAMAAHKRAADFSWEKHGRTIKGAIEKYLRK